MAQPMKDYIDQYMATRSYSKHPSDFMLDDDEGDAEPDDDATQKEFEDFRKWLDDVAPSSSAPAIAPNPASAKDASMDPSPALQKCQCIEVPCTLVGISPVLFTCTTPEKT